MPVANQRLPSVVTFTDTYFPTVNGVTYTIDEWSDRWYARGGRMHVVYPDSPDYEARANEHAVWSLPFPFYPGFRAGVPRVPRSLRHKEFDLVHAHTVYSLGLSGLRLSRKRDIPLVVSYHTPISEYADYVVPSAVSGGLGRGIEAYERRILNRADAVVVPSQDTRQYLKGDLGVHGEVSVISNGIDIDFFRPMPSEADEFCDRHDLPTDRTLVGYTGRHGHEKSLDLIVEAVAGMDVDEDVTVVFGGDGPARSELESMAEERGVDARFLGFLAREEMPAFYSSLDAFLFPSPVETEGLVGLEAMACGTPVVGANAGALKTTIDDASTGYRFEPGHAADFRSKIRRVLSEGERLRERCLNQRGEMSVDHAVDELASLYQRVL